VNYQGRIILYILFELNKAMEKDPLVISNKSCKIYFLVDGSKVYFSGDFDSGNLEKAEQISPYTVCMLTISIRLLRDLIKPASQLETPTSISRHSGLNIALCGL
jgi:hypothetical protein